MVNVNKQEENMNVNDVVGVVSPKNMNYYYFGEWEKSYNNL